MSREKAQQLINTLALEPEQKEQLLARLKALPDGKVQHFFDNLRWLEKAQAVVDVGTQLSQVEKLRGQLRDEAGKIVKEVVQEEITRTDKQKEQQILTKINQL